MLTYYYAQLALDISAERQRAAERHSRLFAGAGPDFDQPSRLRTDLARLAVLVHRGVAGLARRLHPSHAQSAR